MKKIRLWKVGDHTQGILPDKKVVDKLVKLIQLAHNSKGDTDIIWDSMISVEEIFIDDNPKYIKKKKNNKKK